MKRLAIYIMTNKPNGTLYTDVISDLIKRVYEHKNGVVPGFTKKYGSRDKKVEIVESMNSKWEDLYVSIL